MSWELCLMFPPGAWEHHILCSSLCRWEGGDATWRLRVWGWWWRVRCMGDSTGNQNVLQAPNSVLFKSPYVALNFLHEITWQDPADPDTSRNPISCIQSCVLWHVYDTSLTLLQYLINGYGLRLKILGNNESTTALDVLFQWLSTCTIKTSYILFQASVNLSLCFRYVVNLCFCLWFNLSFLG